MSTKTSFKRIAAVAAVALALGGFSAVSANAAATVTFTGTGLTTPGATAGATATVGTYLSETITFTSDANNADSIVSSGVGSLNVPAIAAGTDIVATTAITATSFTAFASHAATDVPGTATRTLGNINGTGTVGTLIISAYSAVAGIQTITVHASTGDSTLSIVWGGGTSFSAPSTIVRSGSAITAKVVAGDAQGSNLTSTLNYTSTLDAVPHSAGKSAGTAIAVIEVVTVNADGTAATQANKVSATVSGSGLVWVNQVAPVAITAVNGMSTNGVRAGSTTLDATHNVAWVYVYADGTAGVGTVTVSVTDGVSGATTVVGTKTVTSYGSVASLSASVNYSIGKAGYTTGAAVSTLTASSWLSPLATGTEAPAFVVTAKDSAGYAVTTAAVPTVSSSDPTVVTTGACALDDGSSSTYSSSSNGVGVYNCDFTSAPNAASGSKATLTIKVLNPADVTGTTYLTTTVPVTIGGKVASTTLTSDAASYSAGQAMVVTFTAKDASGNPVYDGATSPAASFVSSKALGGSVAGFSGWYVGGVDSSATALAKSTTYAPSVAGPFVLTATDSTLAALSLSLAVAGDSGASDAAQAATDAAQEATDAANAAYDAANNAMDSADAATAAAQDASDNASAALAAVTSLSATVAKLVSSVTAIATALAAIKKKLGVK